MPDLTCKYLVSTQWLADHRDAPDVVIIDGSWHLPVEKRDPRAEYAAGHIPGARFFDIDAISDQASSLPHMLPPPEKFASHMKDLGIGDGDCVVAYDASVQGLFSAARVWWTLRAFGHGNVAVLDGGLTKWRAEGRVLTSAPPAAREARGFGARPDQSLVRNLDQMGAIVTAGTAQIADARANGRFQGREPEPRPGLRSGHMPGACNVPFASLLSADGTLKQPAELRTVFERAGIDVARPIVTTCGSGVTAAVLSLALAVLGSPANGLYDGSWSEWGQENLDTAVVTGT